MHLFFLKNENALTLFPSPEPTDLSCLQQIDEIEKSTITIRDSKIK